MEGKKLRLVNKDNYPGMPIGSVGIWNKALLHLNTLVSSFPLTWEPKKYDRHKNIETQGNLNPVVLQPTRPQVSFESMYYTPKDD